MFKLFVGGKLIQTGNKLSDLTLLLEASDRDICPYHLWVISTDGIEIDVSRYNPATKLIKKDIHYFDGIHNNIFRICNGLGHKLFSVPEFNDECVYSSETINKWVSELKSYNIEDEKIAKFVADTKNIFLICSFLEYSPYKIVHHMIPFLKLKYTVSQTDDSFTITEHSWCLGEPMESSRTVHRIKNI